MEGARELLFLSLKKNHEKITREMCGNILSIGNLEGVVKKLLILSSLWADEAQVKVKMLQDFGKKKKDKTYQVAPKDGEAMVQLGLATIEKKTKEAGKLST
jgi:hypothetical protein